MGRPTKNPENGNILPPKIQGEVACWPRQSGFRLWDPCHSCIRGEIRGVVDVKIFCSIIRSLHKTFPLTSTDHVLHCEAYSEQPSFLWYVYQSNVIFVLTDWLWEVLKRFLRFLSLIGQVTEQWIGVRSFGLQAGDLSAESLCVCQLLLSQITKSVKQWKSDSSYYSPALFHVFLHLGCMELIPTDSPHSPCYSSFGVRLLTVQPGALLVSAMLIMFSSFRGGHIR